MKRRSTGRVFAYRLFLGLLLTAAATPSRVARCEEGVEEWYKTYLNG